MSRVLWSLIVVTMLVAVPGAPGPVRAQAAPGPFVKQAFDLLMDRFVVPPSAATLLGGGWSGALAFLKDGTGAAPAIDVPAFPDDPNAAWSAFQSAYPQLVAVGGPALDQHALDYAIVSGMAKSLNSSHTFVFTASPQAGQTFGGVGIMMSAQLVVTDVYPGTPAEAAGVHIGDRLVAVDGTSVEGMKSDEVSPRIRGPVGSTVQLTIRRGSQPEPVVLTATRAEIAAPWVTARVLDRGIGVLRIPTFPQPDAIGQFDQAIATLEGADINALVIDVRGNRGGAYATSAKVVSRFVQDGAIRQCAPRQGAMETTRVDGSAWGRNIPIAVLVNEQTGAGGEELPATLRETGVGYLVGKRTYGALAGGRNHPLQDGSTLQIAVSACRSGQGQEIEGVGLAPDQVVELDPAMLAEGKDSQLEAALTYLREKLGQ